MVDPMTIGPQARPHVILYFVDDAVKGSPELISTLVKHGIQIIMVMGRGPIIPPSTMIKLGVRGVVGAGVGRREMTSAIRHIAWGRSYISPSVATELLSPQTESAECLTPRELEILVRVAAGDTDREIARELMIAVRTVRSHLDSVRAKTGQRRRPDLTRYAIMQGIWPPQESLSGAGARAIS